MEGNALKGPLPDHQLNIIENGALLVEDGIIKAAGHLEDLAKAYHQDEISIVEIMEPLVCLPGFIDAHTHICSAGSRANDYALRNAGSSYLEIAKQGGGIWDTVTHTRNATESDLCAAIVKRANRHFAGGVTTIEVKSGYGLSPEYELKMLRAIQEADKLTTSDLIATCLAAHIKPKDFSGNAQEYLRSILIELLPVLRDEKICNRIDAFIEEGAFSEIDIKQYLNQAQKLGFDITLHADQFSVGGSKLAVECGAVSADHLEVSTDSEIELIANSEVVAVALPGASMGLGCGFAPARKLLDAGACLAIASDWNPGSAPMGDLLLQASVLGCFEKMTNAEVLAAITFRAAHALRKTDRGVLTSGKKADFSLFSTTNYQEIFYQQGGLKPSQVWKDGQMAFKMN